MKRLFVALLCLMCIFNARADNNNTATSKDYVDTQIETLQDEIPAIDTNTVLTHTGISGEIGSKKIYDANSDYASQQTALVTAETFNSAVQNAIDTEFVCIDWLGEHIPGNCLLWQIRPAYHQSPNLFRGPYFGALSSSVSYVNDGYGYSNYSLITSPFNPPTWFKGPIFVATVIPGDTYSISAKSDAKYSHYAFYESEEDITDRTKAVSIGSFISRTGQSLTVPNNAHVFVLTFTNDDKAPITWSDVQCVHGSTLVPYQPYGENTWLPEN